MTAYCRALADLNLCVPDGPLHRQQRLEADRLLRLALDEQTAREVEESGWEWEPWETANGIML